MSSIVVAGDTSGTCTLQAPAVAGSTVLTLPTTSATLITDSSGILNIGSGQIYKDASGNVGIGTSSPSVKLDVVGANDSTFPNDIATIFIQGTDAYNSGVSGSGIQFKGLYSSTNLVTVLGGIWCKKTNTNSGDYGGYLAFGTRTNGTGAADMERMRIDSTGNLLVGATTSNAGKVTIITTGNASASMAQTGTTGDHIYFRTSTNTLAGYITSPTGTTVSYISVSDQRLKENIVDAPSALASINAIKVRSFDWKVDGIHQDYGYIAQELLEVAPEAVSVPENEDEMMGVDFGKLTPRLVKAIQELKTIIDTQQEQINSLLEK